MKVSCDDRIHLIKKTAWLHDTLFEALTEINSIFSIEVNVFNLFTQLNHSKHQFSLKIVFVLLSTLVSHVFATFYFIQTLKIGVYDEENIKTFVISILWVIWQTIPIGLAIHYASKTTECVSLSIFRPQKISTNFFTFKG